CRGLDKTALNAAGLLAGAIIVLGAVNALGLALLLAVQPSFIGCSEFAAILFPHMGDFAVQTAMLALQAGSLTLSQFTALDALLNAVLLVFLALAKYGLFL